MGSAAMSATPAISLLSASGSSSATSPTTIHTDRKTTVGVRRRSNRVLVNASEWWSCSASDLALAKPPAKNNNGITWSIQVATWDSGMISRAFWPTSQPSSSITVVATQ